MIQCLARARRIAIHHRSTEDAEGGRGTKARRHGGTECRAATSGRAEGEASRHQGIEIAEGIETRRAAESHGASRKGWAMRYKG